ncbi:MAG: hypothetical protein VX043_00635 [Candidatus Thermoplasmatota archaeon]|nr:hypothetical protein [Candidatus Thermoplasmatota archaeon]MEC8249005.1 hypothetical protein [Candidatus Thermoplasmatota archaeon]MEC8312598.1 hypothetical protein [Candidatus Thermoplasmatota archaeon]
MTIISPGEYDLLMSLTGQEQNLQASNIGKKYGLSSNQILSMLPGQSTSSGTNSNSVALNLATAANHRFEYDPSPDASQRRESISHAVSCPGCGAALGIPSIRPIKVTCPQCLQEHTFLQ